MEINLFSLWWRSCTLGVYVHRHGADVSSFFDTWVRAFSKKIKGLSDISVISKSVGGDPIAAIPGGKANSSGHYGHRRFCPVWYRIYAMHAGQMCGDVAADAIVKGNVSATFFFFCHSIGYVGTRNTGMNTISVVLHLRHCAK